MPWVTAHAQGWDGVTPPAIPAGWTVNTTYLRTEATNPSGAPNSLAYPGSLVHGGTVPEAEYNTADSASGEVRVSVRVRFEASADGNQQQFWAHGRKTTPVGGAWGTNVFYGLLLERRGTIGLTLFKRNGAGASINITSTVGGAAGWSDDVYYWLILTIQGTALTGECQRASDGQWLGASGAWQSTRAAAVSATDTSISGSGTVGAGHYTLASGATTRSDDFLMEQWSEALAGLVAAGEGGWLGYFEG